MNTPAQAELGRGTPKTYKMVRVGQPPPFVDYTGFAGGVWDISNASNTDHFGSREYAKTQARWLTPDPAGLAVVNPWNPQTWNRYAYALNNPVSLRDPSGLVTPICEDAGDSGDGGGCNDDGGSGDLWNNGDVSGTLCGVQYSFDDCGGMGGLLDGTFGDAQGYISQECAGMSARACQGMLAYNSTLNSDPCVYLNDAGTGVELPVDNNSSPKECAATQGQWLPPQPTGTTYGVSNGVAYPISPGDQLNPNAMAIFTSVGNSFPGWLSAQYFPGSVCTAITRVGEGSLLLGLMNPRVAPIAALVGTGAGLLILVGCP
jgi:RHS repeat-associated protein